MLVLTAIQNMLTHKPTEKNLHISQRAQASDDDKE